MFMNAIQKVDGFTKPILIISRTFSGTDIQRGAATMFFVNDDYCAITCNHVAQILKNADDINKKYSDYKEELAKLRKDNTFTKNQRALMRKYNYQADSIIDMKIQLHGIIGFTDIDVIQSDKYDLAILKFNGVEKKDYQGHAVFFSDIAQAQPGKSLCRLGYPFSEYDHYTYNNELDTLQWVETPPKLPRFPMDGIITRLVTDENRKIVGIEMSTPGLMGQSGGPLFDSNGIVYGMQFMTSHIHLGFPKVEQIVQINGKNEKVTNNAFLHLGHCLHFSLIKEFLQSNNIKFFDN